MDRKLIFKMVENCLKQYNQNGLFSADSKEYDEIYHKILALKSKEKESTLHDIVNDVVYGFLTDSPYF
ncbi:hypothetical protein BGM26_09625 [Bacillus sp. FJAT-29790]|uniref:YqzH family protein n=1 Tax=Bacillus sp. FJAT-29790 TaxID=1895002 RepID=UPI001C22721B|nr:YqzH family protein [Bacillus sp. FJAT-29790]MBU8879241.1 hypothetical protein [Bacillus sp. FJAT-29790]